jgi:hypothetical protein
VIVEVRNSIVVEQLRVVREADHVVDAVTT